MPQKSRLDSCRASTHPGNLRCTCTTWGSADRRERRLASPASRETPEYRTSLLSPWTRLRSFGSSSFLHSLSEIDRLRSAHGECRLRFSCPHGSRDSAHGEEIRACPCARRADQVF